MTLSVDDARERICGFLTPCPAEQVALHDAFGRVLATDIEARRTQPPFATSAMDGYAVRSGDLATRTARLRIVGRVAAGGRFEGEVHIGEAVEISTGARIPNGTDAVIACEDTRQLADYVVIDAIPAAFAAGRHIRKLGVDFNERDFVLEKGRCLSPRDIGLAAAANHAVLPVHRKPRVGIVSTGNELARPGEAAGANQIIDSTSHAIAAAVTAAGGQPVPLGIARDDMESTRRVIETAESIDLLVTIGGISVGNYDVVLQTLLSMGLLTEFRSVALRPGKPMMFGHLGGLGVIGLPGNPVSALVCAMLFLRPAIKRLSGELNWAPPFYTVRSGKSISANGCFHRFVIANLARHDGATIVIPTACQDTSVLSSFAQANCLIVRPPGGAKIEAGEPVPIMPLETSWACL